MNLSQSRKANVRTQKWRTMLRDGLFKDQSLLYSRIRKGIPPSIRSLAWPAIINLQSFKKKANAKYPALSNTFSQFTYEINLDIPRTFPEEEDSKALSKSLNNVLKGLSLLYPEIGYCQGMNFIVHRVLNVLEDEDAFWLMVYLFETDPSLKKTFLVDVQHLKGKFYVLEQLMQQHIPEVFLRLRYLIHIHRQLNIIPQLYAPAWFITLYSNTFSQPMFSRVFELYLIERSAVIYGVAIALMKKKQHTIIEGSFEDIMRVMKSEIYKVEDEDAFMDMVYAFKITEQETKRYEEEYHERQGKKEKKKETVTKVVSLVPQEETEHEFTFMGMKCEVDLECLKLE